MAKSAPIPRERDPRAPKELQLKFRLSRELHDSIAEAANRSGRSVSQEIRRRLEISAAENEQTSQLVEAIKLAAQATDWRRTPRACAIFRAAVDALLRQFQPPRGVDDADAASIAQEGAMVAGVALGALGLSFQVGTIEPKGRRASMKEGR
jgi:hypothetical protein